MDILIKIFYGILLFAGGFFLIKHVRAVKSWTGNFYWAERYLGSGSTYLVLKLIGLGMMMLGVMYPFGVVDFGPGF